MSADDFTETKAFFTPTGSPSSPSRVWNRPVFRTGRGQLITAGGLLFFCRDPISQQTYFLLSKDIGKLNRYEDIGGKTDQGDQTIEECIAREVAEELNVAFRPSKEHPDEYWLPDDHRWTYTAHQQPPLTQIPDDFQTMIRQGQKLVLNWIRRIDRRQIRFFYIGHSKYRLILMELPAQWLSWRNSAYFDQREFYENRARTCHWISASRFQRLLDDRQINPRLNQKPVLYLISQLAQNYQIRLSINPPPKPPGAHLQKEFSQINDDKVIIEETIEKMAEMKI